MRTLCSDSLGQTKPLLMCLIVCFVCYSVEITDRDATAHTEQQRKDKSGPKCPQCRVEFSRLKSPNRAARKYKVEGIGLVCYRCHDRTSNNAETANNAPSTPVKAQRRPLAPVPLQDGRLLSPEQREQCVGLLRAASIGHQGRQRTELENARALLHADGLFSLREQMQKENAHLATPPRLPSDDRIWKSVASAEQTSSQTLKNSAKRLQMDGALDARPTQRIRRDDPRHALFGEGRPSVEIQSIIHRCVEEAAKNNTYLSIATFCAAVFTATGETVPRSTMHSWLQRIGLEYGEKKLTGLTTDYRAALIRSYLFAYSKAWRDAEARRSKYVLLWMDESYIHQGYCSRFSWFHRTDDVVPHRVRGFSKGKRLIILHAMTRYGMLESSDLDAEGSDNLEEEAASAMLVTPKLSVNGVQPEDYHDTLDGEKFVAWMRKRLFPAFNSKFPGKAMILVLDNAKYHHARGPDWFDPKKMNKWELGRYLREAQVKQLTVQRKKKNGAGEETLVIPASKFTADLADGGPLRDELLAAVCDYVKSHPVINTTLVQQAMREHNKLNQLLYTPPYESWLQPIELVWARVKHEVATHACTGRTHQQTADQTKAALRSIDKNLCESIILHTHKLMEEWMKSSEAGSLSQFSSFESLAFATPQQRNRVTDLALPDSLIIGDAEKE